MVEIGNPVQPIKSDRFGLKPPDKGLVSCLLPGWVILLTIYFKAISKESVMPVVTA